MIQPVLSLISTVLLVSSHLTTCLSIVKNDISEFHDEDFGMLIPPIEFHDEDFGMLIPPIEESTNLIKQEHR